MATRFWVSLKLFCLGAVASVVLGVPGCPATPAHAWAARPGAVIACFHKKIGRVTGQAHPSRCNVAGYKGNQFVEMPIKGMNWGHWGSNPTRAAYGIDKRSGEAVRIIAFKPLGCGDGRRWYSRAVVFSGRGDFFGIRLPVCGRSPLKG